MDKSVKYTRTSNKAMAFLTVEDLYGSVEVIVFSNLYEKYNQRLQKDQVLVIQGKASVREDEDAKLIANDFLFYEDIKSEGTGPMDRVFWIKIPKQLTIPPVKITDILQSYRGNTRVMIYNERLNQKLAAKENYWVSPCGKLIHDLEELLGGGAVKLVER